MAVLHLYKPLGWTPLQAMEHLRAQDTSFKDSVMTYAGRLDPMAEGVMLVLTDEDRMQREEYMGCDKEYRATMLLGYSSDSYDALGLVRRGGEVPSQRVITATLQALGGEHALPFPPYSAYKVQGKPLHWWAQQDRLGEIAIPVKHMRVKAVRDLAIMPVLAREVSEEAMRRIRLVSGDFRQNESILCWQDAMAGNHDVTMVSVTLTVTSGTYIRSLAEMVGRQLGCGALLFGLQRTSVGTYRAEDAVRLIG